MKDKRALHICLMALWLLSLLVLGKFVFQEPQIEIPRVLFKIVEIEKIVEVERVIEKIVEKPIHTEVLVEVIREVPIKLRSFESLQVLREWLETRAYYIPSYPGCDCDDFAQWRIEEAEADGYRLSTELDWYYGEYHMYVSTIIGNHIYLIDAQSHEIVKEFELD